MATYYLTGDEQDMRWIVVSTARDAHTGGISYNPPDPGLLYWTGKGWDSDQDKALIYEASPSSLIADVWEDPALVRPWDVRRMWERHPAAKHRILLQDSAAEFRSR